MSLTEPTQWINNYNAPKTRLAALTSYNRLVSYLEESNITISEWVEDMKKSDDAKYVKLGLFCKSLKLMPASVRQYYAFIKNYLRVVHGIKIDLDDQRQFIKFEQIQKTEKEPITKEIIKDFCKESNQVFRTFLLIQSSSGMRATESLGLTESNFAFDMDPVMVTIPASLTKTQTERVTFISSEAVANLERCEDYFKPKSLNTIEWYFWKIRKNLGYVEKYEGEKNYKVNIHSLRAFVRTQAGKVNRDFGESILGHAGYLQQYVRLTKKEKIEYYKKLEPKLRIFN